MEKTGVITKEEEFYGTLISISEICEASSMFYDSALIKKLTETMPSREVLRLCSLAEFMLIPGPPVPLSFSDMIDKKCDYLRDNSDQGKKEPFFNNEYVKPEWLVLRKPALMSSTRDEANYWKILKGIEDILRKDFNLTFASLAIEIGWCLFFYKKIKKGLFKNGIWDNMGSFPSISKIENDGWFKGHGVNVHLMNSLITFTPSGCGYI